MIFTGKNLEMVQRGIELAIAEIHTQIGSCPDIYRYAEWLVELENERDKFERLLARIEKAQAREAMPRSAAPGRRRSQARAPTARTPR